MKLNPVLDVADLPTYAFGHRSILWWGTVWFCLIEATAFGLALVAYFYLRSKALEWPSNVAPPPLLWGTLIRLMQPPRRDCGSKIRHRPRAAAPLRSEVPSRARRGPKPARDRVF